MLESRRGQAPDNNDNSASTTPAMTADERMRLEKSQSYDRGRYVRVQKGDALTRLTADQVEFGATIAYNRLRNPNHIEVGQDLFIPERGTYNEDAAKQVANAYWKAEEAAQEAARLQRIKAEGETQEGRWYQSGSSSPCQERTVQELRDYFNNMENRPGYQAVQYIRKNPGGSSFVKDMVDVIRPLNSGFGTVFTIAADYLGEKQAGLTGYNSVTHQFYGSDEQRDIRRSLALDAMLSAVPFGRLGANGVGGNTPTLDIPGRVQSRINLRNGSQAEGAGWNHVVNEHFSGKASKSQFTVDQVELKTILQSKGVVQAPVTRILESANGPLYVREIDLGRNIGVDKFSNFQPTSTFTVLTDRYGNLVTTTPGKIK